jgi:hypothetical protein
MWSEFKAAAILLLQLALHNGNDDTMAIAAGAQPSSEGGEGGDFIMVHSMMVDPSSLATHRTDLFRFDYPYLNPPGASDADTSNGACERNAARTHLFSVLLRKPRGRDAQRAPAAVVHTHPPSHRACRVAVHRRRTH